METQKTQGEQKEPSTFPAYTGQEEPAAATLNPNPEKRFSTESFYLLFSQDTAYTF